MRVIGQILTIVLLISSQVAFSHGGGLDKQGGHNDRKRGEYHCHQPPCSDIQRQSTQALEEARKEDRAFSLIYNRKDWAHWSDFDNDCMNTRHETLKDQADGPIKLSPDGCYVSTGLWLDPFSGKTFTRASDLDVDHIIPLNWAHTHGGANWSKAKKERFANDPINLLAVDDGLNQQKGAKGPDQWMPQNKAFRCKYLTMWATLFSKYGALNMTSSENRTFQKQIKTCEG